MKNLTKKICARHYLQDAFDFSEISNAHLSHLGGGNAYLQVDKVGYFKDETKGNLIVVFVGLRPKMYYFTVCDAFEPIQGGTDVTDVWHKAVANGVERS